MSGEISFTNLLAVSVVAVVVPFTLALVPRLRVPAVVVEILAGIALGPSGVGLVAIDAPVEVVSLVGLSFLLFLAGLEIDTTALHGSALRRTISGHAFTLALGFTVGVAAAALDVVRSPVLLAIALSATSLGLVVPVLKDAGHDRDELGQLVIAGATLADFMAIVLLSLFFSQAGGSTTGRGLALAGVTVVAVAAAVAFSRAGRNATVAGLLVRLQDTSAEIRVRFALALMVGFVALSSRAGLETILGAFLAGVVLNTVDRDAMSHPNFRLKLDAIGYGFVIPVFFVASGLRFDLRSLLSSPSALAAVPAFLVALLAVHAVPALALGRSFGTRGAWVWAFLGATSLPLLVTASELGVALGALSPVTAAALVSAGLLSVVVFPPVALGLLAADAPEGARNA